MSEEIEPVRITVGRTPGGSLECVDVSVRVLNSPTTAVDGTHTVRFGPASGDDVAGTPVAFLEHRFPVDERATTVSLGVRELEVLPAVRRKAKRFLTERDYTIVYRRDGSENPN